MADTAIQFSVLGISDKIFSFNTPPDPSPEVLGKLDLKLAVETLFEPAAEVVTIRLDIRTFYKQGIPEQPTKQIRLIRYLGEMHFHAQGARDQFADPGQAGEFLLPRQFVATLLAITFSTCRGIVYARLGGSEIRHMILPLVQPMQVLEKSGEFIRPGLQTD